MSSDQPYTPEEAVAVNQALRTHRATTQTAERALRVSVLGCVGVGARAHTPTRVERDAHDGVRVPACRDAAGAGAHNQKCARPNTMFSTPPTSASTQTAERTRDLANATLEDLHDQGDQLARVQGDLNTV